MPCYSPLQAWRARTLSPNGKRPLVFTRQSGFADLPVTIPCGRCIGCKLARAAAWAVRANHEAGMHEETQFLTLTYDGNSVPPSVQVSTVQKFLKRLRKAVEPRKVRYMYCGEYGSRTLRPHYHLLIFGLPLPPDAVLIRQDTSAVFTSRWLASLWKFGLHEISPAGPGCGGYMGRYAAKALMDNTPGHEDEFLHGSRRPPVGVPWLEKHYLEFYGPGLSGSVTLNGKKYPAPTTYDRWMEKHHPEVLREALILRRIEGEKATKKLGDLPLKRLAHMETAKYGQIRSLNRGL